MTKDELRFETPLYTVAEAARFLDVPVSTFATWAHGYEAHPKSHPVIKGEPILTVDVSTTRSPSRAATSSASTVAARPSSPLT